MPLPSVLHEQLIESNLLRKERWLGDRCAASGVAREASIEN
jgi:hypothetical protein